MGTVRRTLALLLAVVFLGTAVGPALANELEQQLNHVQRQMDVQQNKLNKAQQQVDSVTEQLHLVQRDLDNAVGEYNSIRTQLQQTERQIDANEEILAKTERSLAERSKILNRRMRDIYENGQVSYVDVLFGAADFADFATRMEVLKRVLQQDVNLISKIQAERALVVQKREELERDRAAILELQKAAEAKKQLVQQRRNERQAVLDRAVNERDIAEQAYQELLETSRQIGNLIRSQGGRNIPAGSTGSMMWPISGQVTSPFGWRTHPIFGTARYHSGIDIGADYGDPIVAADGGTVIYAGWMGGYGNAVIIDHGRGISTLYGHNSSLNVVEGQVVRKGQLIALAGSTGYSTGPHCHFEVRENGAPVDPGNYI